MIWRRLVRQGSGRATPILVALAVAMAGFDARALGSESIRVSDRIEVDGVWDGGAIRVVRLVREEPDSHPEVKGFAVSFDLTARLIHMPPFIIEVPPDVDIDEGEAGSDDSYELAELRTDWRLKIEVEIIAPLRCRALQIDVDRKAQERQIEIEAFVEASEVLGDETQRIVLLGVPCIVDDTTVIESALHQKQRADRPFVDVDEQRPAEQLVLFGRLTLGGEVQLDLEYKDDYDLDAGDNEDTTVLDTSTILEARLDLAPTAYAFAKMRSAKGYVLADEERDLDLEEQTQLEELNVYWEDIFDLPVALHLGRQDFDEPREWLYDENLDAVRVYWRPDPFEVEYAVGSYLADEPRGRDETTYQFLTLRWHYAPKSHFAAYVIDVQDRSDRDDSPFYVGLRAMGRHEKSVRYWLDYSYLDGVNGRGEITAHAGDVGVGYQARHLPLRPYAYAAYAFATGDRKSSGRSDRNYRQTGLHDNTARMFGVASFSYYGELLDPELSNLHVLTLAIGVKPVEWASLDLVYHRYRQHAAADFLRDSSLRESPTGFDVDIGEEIDLIIGLDKLFRHLDVEIDVGYFIPGRAFGESDRPAFWLGVQMEWNF
ncbi:MAG: alginate export family protein [Planctomycetota bacterium]